MMASTPSQWLKEFFLKSLQIEEVKERTKVLNKVISQQAQNPKDRTCIGFKSHPDELHGIQREKQKSKAFALALKEKLSLPPSRREPVKAKGIKEPSLKQKEIFETIKEGHSPFNPKDQTMKNIFYWDLYSHPEAKYFYQKTDKEERNRLSHR